MAIMRTGPGKRTKTTSKKVTAKDVTSKLQSIFSPGGGKNIGKSKGAGALAGVASRAGGVRTLTTTKVTGSKKAGIEGLKAKKKSGEMSKQEANAKIKALKGKNQPVKKIYGESRSVNTSQQGLGKATSYYANPKSIPSDSAKFMQQMQATNPTIANKFSEFMKAQQAKNPGARFEFGPRGGVSASLSVANPLGGKPKPMKGDKGRAAYYVPEVRTVLPNKKKKK